MLKLVTTSLVLSLVIGEPLWVPMRTQWSWGRFRSCSDDVRDSTQKIVGGTTAQRGDNPHQCSLRRKSHFCGASIISDQWLVTAAHCIVGFTASQVTVRCGTLSHASGGQDFKVVELIAHPSFDRRKLDNDIGLIRIEGQMTLGNDDMNKISLPDQGEALATGTVVTVTGWGHTSEGGQASSTLQTLDVPIVANNVCRQQYRGFNDITPQMFCAGVKQGGKDACQGDSGGPVKLNNKLVGVVSWGHGCARPNLPGVYARVASFREWIMENTEI